MEVLKRENKVARDQDISKFREQLAQIQDNDMEILDVCADQSFFRQQLVDCFIDAPTPERTDAGRNT